MVENELLSRAELDLQARFQEGAQAFLSHLDLSRGLSPHTLRAYQSDITAFQQWLPGYFMRLETGKSATEEGQPELLLHALPAAYVGHLVAMKLSKTSVARKGSSIKSFFKFLMKDRYFSENSLPLIFPRPKLLRRLPEFLSKPEIDRLLDAVDQASDSPLKHRNRAMIELLFSSGLRVGEMAALNWEHVHWEQAEFRILGKGNRERVAFASQAAITALQTYHRHWEALAGHAPKFNSPVFLNCDGQRLNVRSVRRLLLELGETAGLEKAVHPHVFRHSFATHLLNHGVDLRIVQELLGHISIRSTQIYTHVSTERLKRAYLKAHPRAGQSAASSMEKNAMLDREGSV
jgi:integrase/recombinase XerC